MENDLRLSITIPRKSAQFIDWVGDEAERRGGSHLSKAAIVRALLNMAMRLDVDLRGINSQRELEERIWAAVGRKAPAAD